MTDRFSTLTVVLSHDMRDDDAQPLIDAICRLRGVLSASGNVADSTSHMAEERAKNNLGQKIMQVILEESK